MTLCEECRRPQAGEEDYENLKEGEGGHLCWGGYGCQEAREKLIDRLVAERDTARRACDGAIERAERLVTRALEAEAGRDAARAEVDRLRACLRFIEAVKEARERAEKWRVDDFSTRTSKRRQP